MNVGQNEHRRRHPFSGFRGGLITFAVGVVFLVPLVSAGPWPMSASAVGATDGGKWQIQRTYLRSTRTFSGISCPTVTSCVAIGSNAFLYETDDGGAVWQNDSAKLPAWATSSTSVSCSAAQTCEFVMEDASYHVFGVSWDSGHWRRQLLPRGNGTYKSLSCTAMNNCELAASLYGAFHWNGSRWTAQPRIPGVGGLTSISCTSVTSCQAVGNIGRRSVLLGWNGSNWTRELIEKPPISVAMVSCASQSSCEAVGRTTAIGNQTTDEHGAAMAWRWDGGSWTQQSLPGLWSSVSGISCAATGSCAAIEHDFGQAPDALMWDGVNWSQVAIPFDLAVNLVSCPTASKCEAVGENGPLAQGVGSWDGSTWSGQTLPTGVQAATDVSCISVSTCRAVLESTLGDDVLQGAGSKWQSTFVRLTWARTGSRIDCTSPTFCVLQVATGLHKNGLFLWSGGSWTPAASPLATLGTGPVSCVRETFCVTINTKLAKSSAVQWNGQSTTTLPLPAVSVRGSSPSTYYPLDEVSCGAPDTCVAVSSAFDPNESITNNPEPPGGPTGFAVRLRHGAWTKLRLPAGMSAVEDVSCIAGTECEAIGFGPHHRGGLALTVAYAIDGTKWTKQAWPVRTGASLVISCGAGPNCVAYNSGSAYRWNGMVWRAQSLPLDFSLWTVSCPALGRCTGVGLLGNHDIAFATG